MVNSTNNIQDIAILTLDILLSYLPKLRVSFLRFLGCFTTFFGILMKVDKVGFLEI